ncbi:CAP domain-containing protein [Pedobacter steynii]|uniref:SCP domain-containing protein n=1 Tax=Pedobacter steynii TaxID=430522 RepID=A0A1D7QLH7_9SPHI|nr:CAP domain-containing protein [Pedobacter steynii]AOM79510.1 hypothetical protein BFS30_21525 [Pedobacter steynii]
MKKYPIIFASALLCILLMQCKKEELTIPEDEVSLVINKINLLRQNGCHCGNEYMPPVPALSLNGDLQNAATGHARDMVQKNYFDHLSPEGGTPAERVLNAGYKGNFRAENLGRGYLLADQVVTAWRNSVSHCRAMMDAKSKEAGVGMDQNYWVVTFGSPMN